MAASSFAFMPASSLAASSGPPAICGSTRSIAVTSSASAARAHVVAVEALELGEIEARRRAADLRQVERRDHLLGREDLLVAVAQPSRTR